MTDDIVERLRFWCELPKGTPLPPRIDESGGGNTWDGLIRAVCANAITEIEDLRAEREVLRARVATLVIFTGAATSGPDLREIKDGQGDAMRPVRTPGGFDQAR